MLHGKGEDSICIRPPMLRLKHKDSMSSLPLMLDLGTVFIHIKEDRIVIVLVSMNYGRCNFDVKHKAASAKIANVFYTAQGRKR